MSTSITSPWGGDAMCVVALLVWAAGAARCPGAPAPAWSLVRARPGPGPSTSSRPPFARPRRRRAAILGCPASARTADGGRLRLCGWSMRRNILANPILTLSSCRHLSGISCSLCIQKRKIICSTYRWADIWGALPGGPASSATPLPPPAQGLSPSPAGCRVIARRPPCMLQDSSKGCAVEPGCSGLHYIIGCFIT